KGRWSTNQTKKYYSIGGSAAVKEKKDDDESELLAHLQELKVKTDIAAKKEKTKETVVASNHIETKSKPQQNDQKPWENKSTDVVKTAAPLPKITTTPKQDSSQIVAVAKKKEPDLNTQENTPAQPVIKANPETNKTDVVVVDKKKEQPAATANANQN